MFLALSKKPCIMQKVSNGRRLWMKRSGHFTRTRLGSWCNFTRKGRHSRQRQHQIQS
ncbi:hypothetical protein CsSME_00026049 [Camellia sinensis var. sinensis]